ERGRIRHRSPAEEAADAAAGEELQIVHPAAPVEEQRHPELDHEARSVAAGLTGRLGVEPAADPERIPGAAKKQKSGPIRQFSGAVAQPERGSRALHMRARGDNVVAHRLGASGCRVTSWQKSPQRKASGGVLHPQIKPPAQDPGSVFYYRRRFGREGRFGGPDVLCTRLRDAPDMRRWAGFPGRSGRTLNYETWSGK